MPESFEPIGQVHDYKKQPKPNAWEPAIWAAICGASTITTVDTLTVSDISPKWLKILVVLTTAGIAAGSAYKTFKSAKAVNQHVR